MNKFILSLIPVFRLLPFFLVLTPIAHAAGQSYVSIKIVEPEQKSVKYGEKIPISFEGTTKSGKTTVFTPKNNKYNLKAIGATFTFENLYVTSLPEQKDFTEVKFFIHSKTKNELVDSLILPLNFETKLTIEMLAKSGKSMYSSGWFPSSSGGSGGSGNDGQNGYNFDISITLDTIHTNQEDVYLFEVFSYTSNKIDGKTYYFRWKLNNEGVVIRANGGDGGSGGNGSSGKDGKNGRAADEDHNEESPTDGTDGSDGGNGGDGVPKSCGG